MFYCMCIFYLYVCVYIHTCYMIWQNAIATTCYPHQMVATVLANFGAYLSPDACYCMPRYLWAQVATAAKAVERCCHQPGRSQIGLSRVPARSRATGLEAVTALTTSDHLTLTLFVRRSFSHKIAFLTLRSDSFPWVLKVLPWKIAQVNSRHFSNWHLEHTWHFESQPSDGIVVDLIALQARNSGELMAS